MIFLLGIISRFPVTPVMILMPSAHAGFILVVIIFLLPRPWLPEQNHIFFAIAIDRQAHVPLATIFALVILAFGPRRPVSVSINEIIFPIAKLDRINIYLVLSFFISWMCVSFILVISREF